MENPTRMPLKKWMEKQHIKETRQTIVRRILKGDIPGFRESNRWYINDEAYMKKIDNLGR